MNHFMLDAFESYRSRLDDILLVYEVLEEIPVELGMVPVMPPFLLPYYNGVVPEDCGISAFVFLAGGHFTLHTFSFRECFFVDLVYPMEFDEIKLVSLITKAFPAGRQASFYFSRGANGMFPGNHEIDRERDFGPHLFLDMSDYTGPSDMNSLFQTFDEMPGKIHMTPIMRPYSVNSKAGGRDVLSILTMIAESHISLHYFPDVKEAYFDIFSCRFFDPKTVSSKIREQFDCSIVNETLISRGSKYKQFRKDVDMESGKSHQWVKNIRSGRME